MPTDLDQLLRLIDLERPHQQQVIRWALTRLLQDEQCGVILADEVGCGKTYEALAILALLWRHNPRRLRRVLILSPQSLVRKWHEELTANDIRSDVRHGLRSYLRGKEWNRFNQEFIEQVYLIGSRRHAHRMWWGSDDAPFFQGVREGGKVQAPEGLYLVNRNLLYASKRGSEMPKPLKYILNSSWDLVIVDEAHHFGKGNECDSLFATEYGRLGRGQRPNFDAQAVLTYRHILLLTATPFELDPGEMVNLLSIAGAKPEECEQLAQLLKDYQRGLNDFYNLRTLAPDNSRRREAVVHLKQLRVGEYDREGLEQLLARWIARNSKGIGRREYALVNRSKDVVEELWYIQLFDKFDDLKRRCAELPLIPFTGSHALAYLELRTLMQEIAEQSQVEGEGRGTFVAMDLQQGLSSYQQLLVKSDQGKPKRLLERGHDRAKRLRRMLEAWQESGNAELHHPKVQALGHLVGLIVTEEIDRLENDPQAWFAKIVVFNKLVAGTAPHLNDYLQKIINPLLEGMLEQLVLGSQFTSVEHLRQAASQLINEESDRARAQLTENCKRRGETGFEYLAADVWSGAQFEIKHKTHAVEAFRRYFLNRASQPLFLIDFLRSGNMSAAESGLRKFIQQYLIEPVLEALDDLIDRYFDSRPDEAEKQRLGEERLYEAGVQRLAFLREQWRSPEVVARYDGETYENRESNRMNFNDRWNPLVLLVSRVGEEGIDLQKQARYILHYDLEWNPAKMEQREGRIDREGYGHGDRPIAVRFFLLKGTYEERIFHTVMQRDQWFQILMGSQRRQLGTAGSIDDPDTNDSPDLELAIDETVGQQAGNLTRDEKEAVMLDLRPR